MAWYDGIYQENELWEHKQKGFKVTIRNLMRDWETRKEIVSFQHYNKLWCLEKEAFATIFEHVEESHDYVIRYRAESESGASFPYPTAQQAAKFLQENHEKDCAIIEIVYAGERNCRMGFSMCQHYFWDSWNDVTTIKTFEAIADGKIPAHCASSYTQYSKAVKEGTKIEPLDLEED